MKTFQDFLKHFKTSRVQDFKTSDYTLLNTDSQSVPAVFFFNKNITYLVKIED